MPAYKNEETNKWFCSFYYTDWTNKRKKKKKEGFKTKREAQAFERDFIDKMKCTPTVLFKNLYENYMEDCKARLKPTTLYRKEALYKSTISPYFDDFHINE